MGRCHVFLQPTHAAAAHTAICVVSAVDHLGVGLTIAWRSAFPATTNISGLGAVAVNMASFAAVEALAIAATIMTATAAGRVVTLGCQLVQIGVKSIERIILGFLGLGGP